MVVAWVVIFAIALALRCGASVYWQNRQADHHTFAFGDSFSYWVLGHQIYEGNEYKFGGDNARISRAPGFPILIAGWHWLFAGKPSVISVRIMNSILGAFTVVAVGWLATLLFDHDRDIFLRRPEGALERVPCEVRGSLVELLERQEALGVG